MKLVIFIAIAIAVSLFLALVPLHIFSSYTEAGTLGDWLAGSTSLIVQAVVVYLLYETYKSQKYELEQQRQLLKVANNEASRKRFEDGYYMLLERYEAVVCRLGETGNAHYKVRRVFPGLADECIGYLKVNDAAPLLRKFFSDRDWWLGDWLRVILMVVKYVRQSDRSEEEQRGYLKLLRGSMSAAEARTLLLHFASKDSGDSITATYLLKNDFFKYSRVSDEPNYEILNKTIFDLYGLTIYPNSHKDA